MVPAVRSQLIVIPPMLAMLISANGFSSTAPSVSPAVL